MRKTGGTVLILLGAALVLAALMMTGDHFLTRQKAGKMAQAALEALEIPASTEQPDGSQAEQVPHYVLNPDMGMPEKVVDGIAYVGMLEIPALELQLPIISTTTKDYLQTAPCRFSGSAYLNNLVIGAHNYGKHFGKIGTLSYGDLVEVTDMDGNRFTYQVADIEILQPDQAELLSSGQWPLSLYTCTLGGRTRLTVRCEAI